ncbi:MAG: recombinase RecT [Candidatus Heimdallarchaeaceae archaeon]
MKKNQLAEIKAKLVSPETSEKLKVLPKGMKKDVLIAAFWNALFKNPQLQQCTPESLLSALLKCAEWGLLPGGDNVYLIPRRNNRKQGHPIECNAQIGYQGLIELVNRVTDAEVEAHVVYENDEFNYQLGTDAYLHHKIALKDRGKAVCAYALWKKDDRVDFDIIRMEEIEKRRKMSLSWRKAEQAGTKDSPWHLWPEAMMRKSAVLKMLKMKRKTPELDIAISEEEEDIVLSTIEEEPKKEEVTFQGKVIDIKDMEAGKEKKDDKPKQIEDQAPEPERIIFFDDVIAKKKLDKERVEEYIETVAKSVNCSMEYVKEKATKKIDRFVEKFKEWEAKNKPATSPPKPKKAKPEKKAQPPAQWLVELEEQLSNYDRELVNEVLKEKGYNSIYDISDEAEATEIYLMIDTKAKELEELF